MLVRIGNFLSSDLYPFNGEIYFYTVNNVFIASGKCFIQKNLNENNDFIYLIKDSDKIPLNCGKLYQYIIHPSTDKYLHLKGLLLFDDDVITVNNKTVYRCKPVLDYANIIYEDSKNYPCYSIAYTLNKPKEAM